MQLGFYPGGSGARYSPHLDRNPGEAGLEREITRDLSEITPRSLEITPRSPETTRDHPRPQVGLKREITFLLYLNVDWDTDRHGGCLRLHPPDRASGAPVDVAPLGGRVVVFQSGKRHTRAALRWNAAMTSLGASLPIGKQLHEVLPCDGADRLALTLWCEYE